MSHGLSTSFAIGIVLTLIGGIRLILYNNQLNAGVRRAGISGRPRYNGGSMLKVGLLWLAVTTVIFLAEKV